MYLYSEEYGKAEHPGLLESCLGAVGCAGGSWEAQVGAAEVVHKYQVS